MVSSSFESAIDWPVIAEASLDTSIIYVRGYNEYVERRKFLIDGLNRIPGCYRPFHGCLLHGGQVACG